MTVARAADKDAARQQAPSTTLSAASCSTQVGRAAHWLMSPSSVVVMELSHRGMRSSKAKALPAAGTQGPQSLPQVVSGCHRAVPQQAPAEVGVSSVQCSLGAPEPTMTTPLAATGRHPGGRCEGRLQLRPWRVGHGRDPGLHGLHLCRLCVHLGLRLHRAPSCAASFQQLTWVALAGRQDIRGQSRTLRTWARRRGEPAAVCSKQSCSSRAAAHRPRPALQACTLQPPSAACVPEVAARRNRAPACPRPGSRIRLRGAAGQVAKALPGPADRGRHGQ